MVIPVGALAAQARSLATPGLERRAEAAGAGIAEATLGQDTMRLAAHAPAPPPPAPRPTLKQAFMRGLHGLLRRSPFLNRVVGCFTGPFIKRRFNAPLKPGELTGPPALSAATIDQARSTMAAAFHPERGKVLVGISGGGKETVHAFVVSDVKPDGRVTITQALAQYGEQPEDYRGLGGTVRRVLDWCLGNKPKRMLGVIEEDWSEYAAKYKRNSIALVELDGDPAKVAAALKDLKGLVGRPYDATMLASAPSTPAADAQMYCTEISAWFLNRLRPGTIREGASGGYPAFQVADHLRATTTYGGGPLRLIYNAEDRLDVAHADPFPHLRP